MPDRYFSRCSRKNGIGKECELASSAAGRLDEVQLRGVREASGDEHLAALRMPVVEAGGAEFEVASHVFAESRRDGRDAFDDEIVGNLCGDHEDGLKGRGGGQKQRAHDESGG